MLCRSAVYFTVWYLAMETGVRRFTDEHGNEVRLTDERLRHILRRHPEMALQMHRFAETLASPEAVRPSMSGRRSNSTTGSTRTCGAGTATSALW